jgi:hypothetical protein
MSSACREFPERKASAGEKRAPETDPFARLVTLLKKSDAGAAKPQGSPGKVKSMANADDQTPRPTGGRT